MQAIVTVREPEFSPADRADMLASRTKDAAPRGAHGFLLTEATDPKNADRFNVDLPLTDFAQAALDKVQKKYEKDWPDADMGSLLWTVTLDD